ncbi:LOG family protein [Candidatus Woesearchaeota archaeon]|nr:LOG family protein [Candidatus Woesearchaeota archaeon]
MKLKIGVMGSALERGEADIPVKGKILAYKLGRAIANHNCIFINGACGGIPAIAAKGAREADGFLVGISPAENFHEHVHKYNFPYKEFDVIFYTGFGFKGRNVVNVSNCDAVIIVSGHMGTLNEFSIAYDEGMVVGVMQGSGGIADFVDEIIRIANKKTGATVIYDTNPHQLIKKVIKEIRKRQTEEKKLITKESSHRGCYRCR